MNKVYCDRCGKEIKISNERGEYKQPKYRISINGDARYLRTPLDLCDECEKKFDEWLKGGKEETKEDDEKLEPCTFIFAKSSPNWCENESMIMPFMIYAEQKLNIELKERGFITMSHVIRTFGSSSYSQRHGYYGWIYASGDRVRLQYEILSNGAYKISTNAKLLSGGNIS